MKLIYCTECGDVFSLDLLPGKKCKCGKSSGFYANQRHAVIYGPCVPLGFTNSSFAEALKNRPSEGMGSKFEAFIIPESCPHVTHIRGKVDG